MIYLVGGFICSHIFVLFCLLGSEPADLRSGLRRAHSPGIGFRGWSFCTSSFSCRCLEMALNNHNMELFALPALGSFGAAGWGCWGCLSVGKKSHAALEGQWQVGMDFLKVFEFCSFLGFNLDISPEMVSVNFWFHQPGFGQALIRTRELWLSQLHNRDGFHPQLPSIAS